MNSCWFCPLIIVPEQVLDGTGWEGGEGCFGLFIIFSSSPLAKEQDGDCFVISSFGIFFDSSDSVVKEQDGEEGRGVLVVDR